MRTRKPKTYYATRGHLSAPGLNKSEAKTGLEQMIDWACSTSSPIIESRFGFVVIVAASPNGYETAVINPTELEHGQRRYCFTCHGQVDYGTALQSARMHAAQLAWNESVIDQDHVTLAQVGTKAAELLSWIAFQRRYIAEKTAGRTDNEAFHIASGLGHLVTA